MVAADSELALAVSGVPELAPSTYRYALVSEPEPLRTIDTSFDASDSEDESDALEAVGPLTVA